MVLKDIYSNTAFKFDKCRPMSEDAAQNALARMPPSSKCSVNAICAIDTILLSLLQLSSCANCAC